jgi:hypothetical protein
MLGLGPFKQCKVLHQEKTVFTFLSDFEQLQLGVTVHNRNLLPLKNLKLLSV